MKRRLTPCSQKLRRNMTKDERRLWYDFLQGLPITVHRQKAFGNYIVDFYCSTNKLAIELDGSQHYEEKGCEYDVARDAYLQSLGIKVLRFSNYELERNFKGVCQMIKLELGLE